jgi:hypothetical protein
MRKLERNLPRCQGCYPQDSLDKHVLDGDWGFWSRRGQDWGHVGDDQEVGRGAIRQVSWM